MIRTIRFTLTIALLLGTFALFGTQARGESDRLIIPAGDGPGQGKHVVLISGDEEYRSEELMPQLGAILARHGFRCTVLFAIDAERDGIINPNVTNNIPGLDALESADLMVIATRFRNLPDAQMRAIDAYLKSGRPVLGLRTATHAFNIPGHSPWAHYSYNYGGPIAAWRQGFGRLVLGETWISHHGRHKYESTLGLIAPGAEQDPIVRGIADGDAWGPTDVYTVRLPLPEGCRPVMLGQVLAGMEPDSPPLAANPAGGVDKNDPMMPIAWTKTYQIPDGEPGRVFTSTLGSSNDFASPGVRRLLVNAAYWCVGLEDKIPEQGTDVDIVGPFEPSMYGFESNDHWIGLGLRPSDFAPRPY